MKYRPEQDWQSKIAAQDRLASNVCERLRMKGYTPSELTDEQRDRVESVTRFERYRGRVLKMRGRKSRGSSWEAGL